jgi:hypothetical protein
MATVPALADLLIGQARPAHVWCRHDLGQFRSGHSGNDVVITACTPQGGAQRGEALEARRGHRRGPGRSARPGWSHGRRGQPADPYPGNDHQGDRGRGLFGVWWRLLRRGNIRAIAKAVGADPGPLIGEYDAVHRGRGVLSAVSLEELLTPAPAAGRRRWSWAALLGVALVAAAGLAGYTFLAGWPHASSAPPAAANHAVTHTGPGRAPSVPGPVTLILRPARPGLAPAPGRLAEPSQLSGTTDRRRALDGTSWGTRSAFERVPAEVAPAAIAWASRRGHLLGQRGPAAATAQLISIADVTAGR